MLGSKDNAAQLPQLLAFNPSFKVFGGLKAPGATHGSFQPSRTPERGGSTPASPLQRVMHITMLEMSLHCHSRVRALVGKRVSLTICVNCVICVIWMFAGQCFLWIFKSRWGCSEHHQWQGAGKFIIVSESIEDTVDSSPRCNYYLNSWTRAMCWWWQCWLKCTGLTLESIDWIVSSSCQLSHWFAFAFDVGSCWWLASDCGPGPLDRSRGMLDWHWWIDWNVSSDLFNDERGLKHCCWPLCLMSRSVGWNGQSTRRALAQSVNLK